MYELEPLISNLHRKDRNSWEQARMIAYVIAQCNSTKKLKPTDIMQFTWIVILQEKHLLVMKILRD